ncbi:MAG: autotransporter domain-containing protein [Endomicrobium sp.]|jgi:outer membrane autotransporter protein|nr:autotransporter domain-containing protein [Endomicrobium sp.]
MKKSKLQRFRANFSGGVCVAVMLSLFSQFGFANDPQQQPIEQSTSEIQSGQAQGEEGAANNSGREGSEAGQQVAIQSPHSDGSHNPPPPPFRGVRNESSKRRRHNIVKLSRTTPNKLSPLDSQVLSLFAPPGASISQREFEFLWENSEREIESGSPVGMMLSLSLDGPEHLLRIEEGEQEQFNQSLEALKADQSGKDREIEEKEGTVAIKKQNLTEAKAQLGGASGEGIKEARQKVIVASMDVIKTQGGMERAVQEAFKLASSRKELIKREKARLIKEKAEARAEIDREKAALIREKAEWRRLCAIEKKLQSVEAELEAAEKKVTSAGTKKRKYYEELRKIVKEGISIRKKEIEEMGATAELEKEEGILEKLLEHLDNQFGETDLYAGSNEDSDSSLGMTVAGGADPAADLAALAAAADEDYFVLTGNMIRSVGSVSYGEEVFREMVRMEKEEEEKGGKWKVYGKGKYKQTRLEGAKELSREYKDSQVGGIIGVTRWLGEEERGFVIGAFVGFDSHSMTQKRKEEKKGGKDLGKESKGRATSRVLGLCGGYIDPRFEVRMLIRGRLNKYKIEKLFGKEIVTDYGNGRGFGGGLELEGKYKIRVSERIVPGPWIGMEASVESYDSYSSRDEETEGTRVVDEETRKGDYSRALLGIGWEVRTKVGEVGVVSLKAGYRRLLSGEVPKVKIANDRSLLGVCNEHDEIEREGIEEGKDIGEVALGLSLDLGKGFGTSAMVKYAVAKHFHDIGANLGFNYKF